MTPSLIAACVWAIAANVMAMIPSRRGHWPQAVALIVTGIPLLGWVTWSNGPFWGLVVLAAGASLLRWPLWFLWRRLRGPRGGAPAE